MHPRNEAMS
ncbi:hypothetical protein MAR_011325 [Mya arenaria]|uniref:Uncharacterized protein n=1 Tax=Mya arenaria TaxID=6604 RepID=A0ABY7FXS2_MYAAR|nr:hypothetical protein MAR_011325 [Mya arenaria]